MVESVLGILEGGQPGRTIAFRADFDALPIQDEKDTPYKSTVPGVMHVCGHDGHTARAMRGFLLYIKVFRQLKE